MCQPVTLAIVPGSRATLKLSAKLQFPVLRQHVQKPSALPRSRVAASGEEIKQFHAACLVKPNLVGSNGFEVRTKGIQLSLGGLKSRLSKVYATIPPPGFGGA
jgi:hypothetical protein